MQKSKSSSSYSKSPTSARHQHVWKEKKQKDKYASDSESAVEVYDNLKSKLQSEVISSHAMEENTSKHEKDSPKELLQGKMEEVKTSVVVSNPRESVEEIASSIQKKLAEENPSTNVSNSHPKTPYTEFVSPPENSKLEEQAPIRSLKVGKMEIEKNSENNLRSSVGDLQPLEVVREFSKNIKATRGLLAGREQEAHVFTDHDRIHELSTLASFNLGNFSAHIFECVCLLLLALVFVSFAFPSTGIREYIEKLLNIKLVTSKLQMLQIYHLGILIISAVFDLLLSTFVKKKFYRFFPFLVIQAGSATLFLIEYFYAGRISNESVSIEYLLLGEFFLIFIHLIISAKAIKKGFMIPKRHRITGQFVSFLSLFLYGFCFTLLCSYLAMVIYYRVIGDIQLNLDDGKRLVSIRDAIFTHVAIYFVFAIVDFITSILCLNWNKPLFLNTRFYRQIPYYLVLLGNTILYALVLFYDLGITAIISIASIEVLSVLCFFLLLRTWKRDKPGTLKVFYGYNAVREKAAEKILNDFRGYVKVPIDQLLKKHLALSVISNLNEHSVLSDFDLETDVLSLNHNLQLERDSQWASVSYQLFVSTDYAKLLRKQVSDWLILNKNYKKSNIISNWSDYCKKVSKHKSGDFMTLCAISNLHNARIVVASAQGFITEIIPDSNEVKRTLLLMQSKSLRGDYFFESVKPKIKEVEEKEEAPLLYNEFGFPDSQMDIDQVIEIKPENEKVVEVEWNAISGKMRRFSKWFHIMAFFFINAATVSVIWLPSSPFYNNMVRSILALSYPIVFVPWKVRKPRTELKVEYKRTLVVVTTYREEDNELMTTINAIRNLDYNQNYLHLMVIQDEYKYNDEKTEIRLKKLLYSNSSCLPHRAIYKGNTFYGFEGRLGNSDILCTLYVKEKNLKKRNSMLFAMNYLKWWNQLHKTDGLKYEYCFMIDSDTAPDPPSLKELVHEMNRRPHIAACCGETEVRENTDGTLTWIQKVQKWEYWASHNINKNFQSVLGCVTCLPGCFSLHRVDDLVGNNYVLQEFDKTPSKGSIKESNLLELGEDRYLTLLMLIWQCLTVRPRKQIKYFSRAHCTTAAPQAWDKYKNQRRRWNNSTYMCIIETLPALTISRDIPIWMKYQTWIEFLGVYLNLSMSVHTLVIVGMAIYQLVKTKSIGFTSWLEITMAVIWIVLQIILALRHKKGKYLPYYMLYILTSPFIQIYLSFFCYQRLDDFNWGTR